MARTTNARPVVLPLAISFALHGALGGLLLRDATRRTTTEEHAPARPDVWSGRGIELDPVPLDALENRADERASAPEAVAHGATESAASSEVSAPNEAACVTNCMAPEVTRAESKAALVAKRARAVPASSASPAVRTPRAPRTAATTIATPSAVTTSGDVAPGAAFGSAGLPSGVRHLPQAYTRALSQGGWGVSGFRSAPAGTLCTARLSITVGDDRSLGPVEYGTERERDSVPELCRALFDNARRLIAGGEFSLDASSLTSGVLRLRVTVEITDGERRAEFEDAPNGLWSESHESPSAHRRGRSTFTLNSGRRVDAFVELE